MALRYPSDDSSWKLEISIWSQNMEPQTETGNPYPVCGSWRFFERMSMLKNKRKSENLKGLKMEP